MWLSRATYERLVAESALALQVPKLELRAEQAETALATERAEHARQSRCERTEHRQEVRHLVSMWLRRNGTYPLPPTADEKAQVKAEQAERAAQPPKLNADQQARLQAAVEWGRQHGFTEEEATGSFMAQLSTQTGE